MLGLAFGILGSNLGAALGVSATLVVKAVVRCLHTITAIHHPDRDLKQPNQNVLGDP